MKTRLFVSVAAIAVTMGVAGCGTTDKKSAPPGSAASATPTAAGSSMATSQVDWEDVGQVAQESADFIQSSTKMVQDQMNAVCGKLRKKGRIFAQGSAPVAGKADQSDWVEARNLAFQRALVEAQIKTIQGFSNEITATISAEMFMPDKAPGASSPEAEIRAASLTPESLDPQKLNEIGVDTAAFNQASPGQRQTMLTNSIKLTATSRAVGSLAGLSVLHSFEGSDGKGGFAIGVCTVTSQKLKDFATMILNAKGNVPPQKDRAMDLNKLIIARAATDEGKKDLINQFGVIRLFDEDGSPALVSFYQAGLQGKSAAVQSQMAEVAKRQATGYADAAIATFLAGSATFNSQQGVEEMVQTMVSDTDESQKIERSMSIQQKFAAQANVRLTGITDLAQWQGKHPLTGKDIVGVVRIWSANQEFTMRSLKDGPTGGAAGNGQNGGATGMLPNATKPVVTKSKTTMDSQDF